MKGNLVIVRVFGGGARVAKVWDFNEQAVFVVSEIGMQMIETKHVAAPLPVGFPLEDTYNYNEAWLANVDLAAPTQDDWDRLGHWSSEGSRV